MIPQRVSLPTVSRRRLSGRQFRSVSADVDREEEEKALGLKLLAKGRLAQRRLAEGEGGITHLRTPRRCGAPGGLIPARSADVAGAWRRAPTGCRR